MSGAILTKWNDLPLRASAVHFGQCIQAALLYRSSLLIFLLTESFSYAGFIAFWYKAAAANPSQTIYTGLSLAAYFAIVSFHHAIQDHAAARDIGSDIRLGKLSYALIRPYPYLLAAALRSAAFSLTRIALLLPLLVAAMLFVPGLWSSFSGQLMAATWWQYPAALLLGLASAIFTRMLVGMLAFDMSQIWGPDTMLIAIYYATSGAVFPIDLAPSWLLHIAQWTPTYYTAGFPTLVLMGRVSEAQFAQEWFRGTFVCFVLVTIGIVMWRRGIKRFEAIGI